MHILGIIPARGGSKGIPRKNIKLLAGLPLIAHSVIAAQNSNLITRLVLSTEDTEIAECAATYNCEVPFIRPAHLADDSSRDLEVFLHCLSWLKDNESYSPDIVVHLRPTAPLRTAAHIDKAINLFLETPKVDCVRTVTSSPQHPLKTWKMENGFLEPFVPASTTGFKEPYNMPRQELGDAYIQNGSVDVVRTEVITTGNSMSGANIKAMIMSAEDSVNIDNPIDWALAEILMNKRT